MRAIRYMLAYSLPATAVVSFTQTGWLTYLPLIYAFGIIPLIDQLSGVRHHNLSAAQQRSVNSGWLYDLIIYLAVPVQWGMLLWFLWIMKTETLPTSDMVGRVTAMGLLCGVLGINVAHELGHRTKSYERFMAKLLLAGSLYMHFFIEHNKGHHRNVGTSADPATARRNEWLYVYWIRTIINSYRSAWRIQLKELSRGKRSFFSYRNEMLRMTVIQAVVVGLVLFIFGQHALWCFLGSALMGVLLLETVNYIEHYGLYRTRVNEHRYEDVEPEHSWNADYVWGRLVLFELTRHSDHHWEPSKHYQLLDSMKGASQLPAGYPAMMLLSLLPPAWFRVMNRRLPK